MVVRANVVQFNICRVMCMRDHSTLRLVFRSACAEWLSAHMSQYPDPKALQAEADAAVIAYEEAEDKVGGPYIHRSACCHGRFYSGYHCSLVYVSIYHCGVSLLVVS